MIDIKMWGRALVRMPRLSHSEWQALDPVARWLIACRASVLFMTFTAAALGGLLAWRAGVFRWGLWLATVIGLMFAHATNNLLNGRGWLVAQRSGVTLNLMLAGVFFVLFYTWPLKYFGLGESAVLLVWGPLMVGGTHYVLAGVWSCDVAWLSLVFALGPTTVLFGEHTDKREADKSKGVNTLPVIIGERLARYAVVGMIGAQYLLCLALVVAGSFDWPLLLVLLNLPVLPRLLRVFQQPKPDSRPANYPAEVWPLWFSAHAFRHTRRFTTLFLIGVVLDTCYVII